MDNVREEIQFSYNFCDKDDGTQHTVTSSKCKECITTDELCEMFVDFMESAGYNTQNIFDYFHEE